MADKEEIPPNKDPNLKGWEFLEKFACLELWSKGEQRLIYDPKKRTSCTNMSKERSSI